MGAGVVELTEPARSILSVLVAALPRARAGQPQTYPTYKQVHDLLRLELRGASYGDSLKHQGLSALAEWAKAEGKPAITGLVVSRDYPVPGPGYFTLYNKKSDDYSWWEAEVAAAKTYDWEPYLQPVARAAATPVAPATARPVASRLPRIEEFHVVCRDNINVVEITDTHFVSGWWKIKPEHDVIGSVLALHDGKANASYLQGRIDAITGRDRDRFQFRVNREPVGLRWRGLSTIKRGYLYADQKRFDHLPSVRCLIGPVDSARSPAVRCLRESLTWDYPMLDQLEPDHELGETARQLAFEADLRRISAINDGVVPYAFRDIENEPYRLDIGCIRYALARGVLTVVAPEQGDVVTAFAVEQLSDVVSEAADNDAPDPVVVNEEYDPGNIPPEKVIQLVQVALRPQQSAFRQALLDIYTRRCPVTGCTVVDILDAAHIVPHAEVGGAPADCRNGILLRTDLHKLFDSGLLGLGFDRQARLRVLIHPSLGASEYAGLHGRPVALPNPPHLRPSMTCVARRAAAMPVLRLGES